MATMSIKEFKLIREILNDLNQEFPPQPIPIIIWKDGVLVKTTSTQDQHFNAYKNYGEDTVWWITCNDYTRWSESYSFMKEYCKLFKKQTGVVCYPCHTHPVTDAAIKREFKNKRCFWVGNLTWTD
jgi:hypothetical protein